MSDTLSLTLPRWDAKTKVRRRKRKRKRPSKLRALAIFLAVAAGLRFAAGDTVDGVLCALDAFFAWEMDRLQRAGRNGDPWLLACALGAIAVMIVDIVR